MISKTQKIIVIAICLVGIGALHWLSQGSNSFAQQMQEASQNRKTNDLTDVSAEKETPASFAFIELFTSEGCSSCPSADENLERIAADAAANGTNVYTLSYHVDYWNRLGWKDPYSSAQFSDRQRDYGRQFESDRIYTPQLVVNGIAEFVGSKRKISDQAIQTALTLAPQASIEIDAAWKDSTVNVHWQAKGVKERDVVNVALVQNSGQQKVTRGENARRNLTHVNIVRELKTDPQPGTEGYFVFETPKDFSLDKYHVVAFVQSTSSIVAAAKNEIGLKPMRRKSSSQMPAKPQNPTDVKQKLVGLERFISLLTGRDLENSLSEIENNWNISYTPMLLEAARFLPIRQRANIFGLLERKTSVQFGNDFDRWFQWNWSQDYEIHPDYAKFKSIIYSSIDPRFAEYFTDTEDARIRLDEVRWGGVKRDGIPPLKNPKMLAAGDADYLADSDVVFGIELNGDARCYPKRILAWHEMFKDTIGGESVCGVY